MVLRTDICVYIKSVREIYDPPPPPSCSCKIDAAAMVPSQVSHVAAFQDINFKRVELKRAWRNSLIKKSLIK